MSSSQRFAHLAPDYQCTWCERWFPVSRLKRDHEPRCPKRPPTGGAAPS